MSIFKKRGSPPMGELMFSNKALISLLVPLVLQQILTVTVGTVDSMMVAYAGEAAVSGVSLVNTLDTVLVIFFTAMVGGGAVVISSSLGAKEGGACEAAKQLLYIATFLAAVLTAVVLILRYPLLNLLFGDAEADVMAHARDYFFFVALSFPLLAIDSSIAASFRSSGNSLVSLIISLMTNVINIGFNALFIIGLGMGAKGAAIATLISRAVASVVYMIIIHNKKHPVHIERLFHYKPDFSIIKRILNIGVANGIENTMFQFGRLMTQSLISTMGTASIAANAVALTLSGYQYMTGTACSSAMITVVGRCVGAKKYDQAKYYSRKILLVNYVLLWAVIAFTMIFLSPLVSAYNLSDYSSELAKKMIIVHALVAAFIWPLGFMLPSSFRSAGSVHFPMVISMVSMWTFRVVGAYFLALDTVSVFGLFTLPGVGLGIQGVWCAMFIDWFFRCPIYLIRYLSGKWIKMKKV